MAATSPTAGGKTRRAIVRLLKQEGALDSAAMAKRLKLTPMAVRQHLYELQDEKLVEAEERKVPLGRPAKYWQLTRAADRLFPDAYAELSVALIGAIQETLGSAGLQRVLDARFAQLRDSYRRRIHGDAPLGGKLKELARIRIEEGYMAEVRREGSAYLFIENHCPICAAANTCQGLCANELDLFQSVLGPETRIERTEHIVAGNRRCVYRIS